MADPEDKADFLRRLKSEEGLRTAWKNADHEGRKGILRAQTSSFTDEDVQQLDDFRHPAGVSDATLDAEIARGETTAFWG